MNRLISVITLCALLVTAAAVVAQRAATTPIVSSNPAAATAAIVSAANAVLASLDDTGRGKVQFAFNDEAQRRRWSNLPSPMFQRVGLKLGDLNPTQRAAVMTLLQTALSANGYRKVTEIMRGDEVLKSTDGRGLGPGAGNAPGVQGRRGQGADPAQGARGGGRGPGGPGGSPAFGEDQYYLAFLGAPSATAPWMLQFGGHHLALNLTFAGARASDTPSLPCAQPATYTFEGREIRPLGRESDRAFELVNGLNETQRSRAILNYRVADLVLGPGQDGRTIQPEGLPASALSGTQQTVLLDIVREWAGLITDAFSTPRLDEIRAGLAQTYFAWSGPTAPGSVAYFRIQGPTVVIEYAPQGNVDHIHTIYRDPTGDYGTRFAKQ
jgi:hypothetical protein